jgi:uncharacterized RDD family membrane protein YckC
VDHNPYSAPRAEVQDFEASSALQLATKGQRFANLLLDTLFYQVFIFVFAFVTALADPALVLALQDYSFPFSLAVMLLYYIGFEGVMGRTPAKAITGTRVVDERGRPASFGQVLGRTFSRIVPFEPFSLLGDPPVGWHDSWSHTRVVRTRHNPSLGPGYLLQNSDESLTPTSLGLR